MGAPGNERRNSLGLAEAARGAERADGDARIALIRPYWLARFILCLTCCMAGSFPIPIDMRLDPSFCGGLSPCASSAGLGPRRLYSRDSSS